MSSVRRWTLWREGSGHDEKEVQDTPPKANERVTQRLAMTRLREESCVGGLGGTQSLDVRGANPLLENHPYESDDVTHQTVAPERPSYIRLLR